MPAQRPNHVWSYDFMATRTRDGGSLRILNVVDEYTRRALAARVARSIGAQDVIAELDKLFAKYGRPEVLRSDNGREFIAASLASWLAERGVKTAFIEKGSPHQNPFVERFNGTMRDELLNGEEFDSVVEARVVIGEWLELYNTQRPHRGLGMMTPAPSPPAAKRDRSESQPPRTNWTSRSPPASTPRRHPAGCECGTVPQ
jgi:transposase InsO family protein